MRFMLTTTVALGVASAALANKGDTFKLHLLHTNDTESKLL